MVCHPPHGLRDATVHERRYAQSLSKQPEDRDIRSPPDNPKSVVEDVRRIRNHALVPNDIPIYGYIYDVKSGKLREVPEATAAGGASSAVPILEAIEQVRHSYAADLRLPLVVSDWWLVCGVASRKACS